MENDHNNQPPDSNCAPVSACEIDRLAADVALGAVRFTRQLRLRRRQTHTLTLTQFSILTVLRRDGPMTPSALAEAERVQLPSITRATHAPEAAGFITRVPYASSTPHHRPRPDRGRRHHLGRRRSGPPRLGFAVTSLDLAPEHRDTLRAAARIMTMIVATDMPPPRTPKQPSSHQV